VIAQISANVEVKKLPIPQARCVSVSLTRKMSLPTQNGFVFTAPLQTFIKV
jgi:hypothetical protein